ncbi:hypothetical protein CN926_00855 [Bacillus thuringiensis]|uniref:hypothetical protein n=1 Tax=Bacillus thuringiensis TaxID=1428 RepID=UPI000BFD9944|nr:hypothetical protein [Bacillus thuringiensis]PGL88584.1 hypothetical protein CN926_00855 [Bacillus thuringiensis]
MIDQRRQQDDFIAAVLAKAQEDSNKSPLLVGRTNSTVSVNATSIPVDFDYYSANTSIIICKLEEGVRDRLVGRTAGQKVLVGNIGSFYVIIGVIA